MKLEPPQTVSAAFGALWQRIRLGEGGLIGMATWVAAWESADPLRTAYVFVLTVFLLGALYLFNDVADRLVDAHNPKKIARHRQQLLQRPRSYLWVSLALHAAVCVTAWWLLGAWPAACAASLLLLNPFYSALAKTVPGLDVLVVGAMGAAVTGLATSTQSLLMLAAAMTGISHAFQTRVDSEADRVAGVRSSGTARPILRSFIWLLLVGSFAVTVYFRLGLAWAVSASIPYVLLSRFQRANQAWGWARAYFAVVWIAATIR